MSLPSVAHRVDCIYITHSYPLLLTIILIDLQELLVLELKVIEILRETLIHTLLGVHDVMQAHELPFEDVLLLLVVA